MVSFNNTEIAFRSKSDADLQKAFLLFSTIAHPTLVKIGNHLMRSAARLQLPINWLVKPTLYQLFVGGETMDECSTQVHRLKNYNIKAILDFSVESQETTSMTNRILEETLSTIKNASHQTNIPFSSFKPSAFTTETILEKKSNGQGLTEAERLEAENFERRIDTLCKTAHQFKVPILIDAEEYKYQHYIDQISNRMMARYNQNEIIVFNTFQMYRKDRLEFLKTSHAQAVAGNYLLGAKFVRGAYMEKERQRALEQGYPSPIHDTKAATDQAYDAALKFAIEHLEQIHIFNGTHNEQSNYLLMRLMAQHQLAVNDPRIWFAQLYGMSDHISFNLAQAGYNVVKYMPYGPVKEVIPYLIRRAEENTSIAGQTLRELELIKKERQRRKTKTRPATASSH